jgi:hypothetical protein
MQSSLRADPYVSVPVFEHAMYRVTGETIGGSDSFRRLRPFPGMAHTHDTLTRCRNPQVSSRVVQNRNTRSQCSSPASCGWMADMVKASLNICPPHRPIGVFTQTLQSDARVCVNPAETTPGIASDKYSAPGCNPDPTLTVCVHIRSATVWNAVAGSHFFPPTAHKSEKAIPTGSPYGASPVFRETMYDRADPMGSVIDSDATTVYPGYTCRATQPQTAITRTEDLQNLDIRKRIGANCVPAEKAHAIETDQARVGAEPEITVCILCD